MVEDPGGTLTYLNEPLLFMPVGQRRAAAGIVAAVNGSDALAMLVGADGAGKTTVLDRVAAELGSRHVRVIRVAGTLPAGLGLLGLVAQVAGRADPAELQDEDRERAFEALTELDDDVGRIALLIDDAQGFDASALRYVQLACRSGPMLRVVMAGPPGALGPLDAEEFAALRARIAHRIDLAPLSDDEAAAIVKHLLRAGGMPVGRALLPAALDVLVQHGRGNPGRLGALLRRALALGVARGEAPVGPETAEQAVAALDGTSPPAGFTPTSRLVQAIPSPPVQAAAPLRVPMRAESAPAPRPAWGGLAWAVAGLGLGASLALAVLVVGKLAPPSPETAPAMAPVSSTPVAPVPTLEAAVPAPAPPTPAMPAPPAPPVSAEASPPSRTEAPQPRPEPSRASRAVRAASERTAFESRLDEQRCREIVLKAQLGEEVPNGDRQFLRAGCRSGR